MAKEPQKQEKRKPASRIKKLLQKRVSIPANGKLGSDVKVPKPLRAIGAYFAGSYQELRQVRWPTRRASLGLTFAVIVFTGIIAALILALDHGFEYIFKQVIL